MFLRVKFFTSRPYDTSTYDVLWELGPPETPQRVRRQMDISPEAPIEFEIPRIWWTTMEILLWI